MSAKESHLKDFSKVFWPFFFSFILSRVILQTDLVMISQLGESGIAAFAIPSRIMFIDTILAFAIAPVIATQVASIQDFKRLKQEVSHTLLFVAGLSVFLCLLGLVLYPLFIAGLSPTQEIDSLARAGLFWMTLSIPFRFGQFCLSMILHGTRRGNLVLVMNAAEVIANGVLNYLFIYKLGMGFEGSFIATFTCSVVKSLAAFYFIRENFSMSDALTLRLKHIQSFLSQVTYEFLRLGSERLSAFLALYLIANVMASSSVMSVYSVAAEMIFFIGAPFIALMRATSVQIAQNKTDIHVVKKFAFISTLALSATLLGLNSYLGQNLYHLSVEALSWWSPFVVVLALLLPLRSQSSFMRGELLGKKNFKVVSQIDMLCQWLLFLPLLYAGLRLSNPWIAWGSYLIVEVVEFMGLNFKLRSQKSANSNFVSAD